MKFTINPQEVSKNLKKAERCIAPKNLIAILSNFLIDVNGVYSTITANNNESCLTIAMPIETTDVDFKFCVDAKKFSQAIGSIKSDTLSIEAEKNELICKHRKGRFSIPCVDASEFPMPTMNQETTTETHINSAKLSNLIGDVCYACANDDLRPNLSGVYFDFTDNGNLTCVATDAHKLVKNGEVVGENEMKSFIMPANATPIATLLLTGLDNDVAIKNDEAVVEFSIDGLFTLTFRQVSGRYPNYNAVFPKDTNKIAKFDRLEFIESLQRVLIFSSSPNLIILKFNGGNGIIMQSQDLDYNLSSDEELHCEYEGEPIDIGFNGQALLSIVSNMKFGNTFTMHMKEPNKSALFKAGDDGYSALLMPMMVIQHC